MIGQGGYLPKIGGLSIQPRGHHPVQLPAPDVGYSLVDGPQHRFMTEGEALILLHPHQGMRGLQLLQGLDDLQAAMPQDVRESVDIEAHAHHRGAFQQPAARLGEPFHPPEHHLPDGAGDARAVIALGAPETIQLLQLLGLQQQVHRLDDEEGIPFRLLHDRINETVVTAAGDQVVDEQFNITLLQQTEVYLLAPALPPHHPQHLRQGVRGFLRTYLLGPERGGQEHPVPLQVAAQEMKQLHRGGIRPMEVFQDQHQRRSSRDGPDPVQHLEHHLVRRCAAQLPAAFRAVLPLLPHGLQEGKVGHGRPGQAMAYQHRGTGHLAETSQLLHQPGLAYARLAVNEDH
ncbi:MAG: hypothetical protein A4E30_00774 [Methanomassiliicoccales archaeon PtaB.Bin215]|nr:MAG: hypothetical protein A4E30_00774 [Methanomassiliicoccales archaeon PtaB.Bin215]